MADYQNPKAGNAILDDLQEIVALIQSGAKMDPTGNTNIPNGAKRVVAVTGGYQIQSYNGTTWVSVGKLMHDCDSVDGKNPNTGTAAGTIPVRDNKGQLPGDITGNAGTATKLATARTIDLGGIVSATEQEFDGSKPITIPVNSVNVNNENDDAVKGVLTPAHGGTGRTDGAAADVIVNSAQGEVKASVYGQIGDARLITGQDLDTLTVSGNYITRGGTVANHYPRNIQEASCTVVRVSRAGAHILQTIICSESDVWVRRSTNTGGSWLAWEAVSGYRKSFVTLYVSKSGNDNNTGLTTDSPVQTISRAMEIVRGQMPTDPNASIHLCLGEGNWGTVQFITLPIKVDIYPYDHQNATEYSTSLPVFEQITVTNGFVAFHGVVVTGMCYATYNGTLSIENSYNRVAELRSEYGACMLLWNYTYNLDFIAGNRPYLLRTYCHGAIIGTGALKLNIAENITVTSAVLHCDLHGTIVFPTNAQITLSEGVSVTGRKYNIQNFSRTNLNKEWLDSIPGSVAGAIGSGCHTGVGTWGGGNTHTFLAADATWRKDSDTIYARDVAVNGDPADLAGGHRGQIGNISYLPLSGAPYDLNDYSNSGIWWINDACVEGSSNFPVDEGGTLVVYGRQDGTFIQQLYYTFSNSGVYWRYVRTGGNWTAWKRVLTDANPYPVFTPATSSAAGAKGLVPAPTKGQTGSYFLNGAGNFMQVPYLRYTVPKGGYVDAVEYMVPEKTNRIACIRVSNEPSSDLGFYTLMLGVNDGDNNAPAGITILRNIETGEVSIETAGDFSIGGSLKVNGSISGQNAFSTGDFCWSYASSKTGFLLCNGAAVSRTTYADLYAIIGTKFGTGDGSTTFNLPDMRGKVAWGANGNLGSVLAAGLPNITGNVTLYTQVLSAGGAFAQGSGGNRADGNYGADHVRFDFNASRSNSIYGASSTVQPPAIALNCFIKY